MRPTTRSLMLSGFGYARNTPNGFGSFGRSERSGLGISPDFSPEHDRLALVDSDVSPERRPKFTDRVRGNAIKCLKSWWLPPAVLLVVSLNAVFSLLSVSCDAPVPSDSTVEVAVFCFGLACVAAFVAVGWHFWHKRWGRGLVIGILTALIAGAAFLLTVHFC